MHKERTKCLLHLFGIDHTFQGYRYCVYCMDLISRNPESLNHITKSIYPDVAKKFNTSCICVERDLRTLAEVVWRNGGKNYFSDITGFPYTDERPSNSKFLALLANCIIWKDYPCENCKTLTKLRTEITSLSEENKWMHDLIRELVQK